MIWLDRRLLTNMELKYHRELIHSMFQKVIGMDGTKLLSILFSFWQPYTCPRCNSTTTLLGATNNGHRELKLVNKCPVCGDIFIRKLIIMEDRYYIEHERIEGWLLEGSN